MTENTKRPVPLDYAPPPPRRMIPLKWLLFAGAIVASLVSGAYPVNSVGGTAAGLWVAFAMIHVQEMKLHASTSE